MEEGRGERKETEIGKKKGAATLDNSAADLR